MIGNAELNELVHSNLELQSMLKGLHPNVDIGRFNGNFNSIYFFYDNKERAQKVLRIWQGNPVDDQQMNDVYAYLEQNHLSFFAKGRHFDHALIISNKKYSVDVMDFVDGKSLVDYVEDLIRLGQTDKAKLHKLADDFKQMCIELKKAKISHGDLSGDNIIVTPDGKLKLIDYDSVCIPKFEGRNGRIAGHGAFNHPNRTRQSMSLDRDHFAEIVIYLTLMALCEKPELWNKYMPTLSPGEAHDPPMLIKESNLRSYEIFTTSKTYKDLAQIPNQNVQDFLDMLAKALLGDGTKIAFPFGDVSVLGNGKKTPYNFVNKPKTVLKVNLNGLKDSRKKDIVKILLAVIIITVVFWGIKVTSGLIERMGNHVEHVEISQDNLLPSLDGSWVVLVFDGQRMPMNDAGATITAQDTDGTNYKMRITSDSKAQQIEVNFSVNRETGELLSPELGNGKVELLKEKNIGNQFKITFDKWILVR